jgi:hypothetical protein
MILAVSNLIVVLVINIRIIFAAIGRCELSTKKNIRLKLTAKKRSYQKTLSFL